MPVFINSDQIKLFLPYKIVCDNEQHPNGRFVYLDDDKAYTHIVDLRRVRGFYHQDMFMFLDRPYCKEVYWRDHYIWFAKVQGIGTASSIVGWLRIEPKHMFQIEFEEVTSSCENNE